MIDRFKCVTAHVIQYSMTKCSGEGGRDEELSLAGVDG